MAKRYYFLMFFTSITLLRSQVQNDSVIRPVPAELLLKEITQRNFRISPNGKLFLEVIEENFESHIVIIDIDAYMLKNRIPMGIEEIGDVIWLTNHRILYERSGEIYAMDIDGTNKVKLVNRLAEKKVKNYYKYYLNYRLNTILSINTGDEDEILIESFDGDGNAYVKKINVYTGEKETLLDGKKLKVNKWYSDKQGNINLGVRFSNDDWKYVRENPNTGEWIPIEINIEGEFYPFEIKGETLLKENILFVDTDFDNEILYLASNINSDKRKLIKYNFKKRYVVKDMLTDINCDVIDDEGADLRILYDYRNKELGGIRYEGLLPQFKPFSDDFLNIKTTLNNKYQSYVNDIIDYDSRHERFVISQWSDVHAGNVGVYDVKSGTYFVMFHLNKELNNYELSKTRNIPIKTEDDSILFSYVNLPLGYKKQKEYPLVVIPHGGPWVRDYWGLNAYVQFFASRGFAVLRVNYRGSTGFGKKHLQAGIEGLGSVMIDDIVYATKGIMNQFEIDRSKVFILGHSYGGYATYMALAKYPDLYRAGVALAAPTDIKKIMKKQKRDDYDFSYDYWDYALGKNGFRYYEQVSPINHVAEISSPILVFHGKFDKIVPVEQTYDMEKEFKKLGKTNGSFRIIEFLGHNMEDSNSLGYVLKESHKFFEDMFEK